MRPDLTVSTTVPAVLAYLTTLFDAIPAVEANNGPGKHTFSLDDVILVGVPDASGEAINHTQEPTGRGLEVNESFDVVCIAGSWRGDDDMQARALRCAEMLTLVRAALAGSRTDDGLLGGLVNQAVIGRRLSWLPKADDSGVTYTVGFTVHVSVNI